MYRPGKILQAGGGWWGNGGGPAGARGAFTVDLTTPGGTATPQVTATAPMTYARHWGTSTVMPDGNVIVTGGSRDNNGNGGYVTNAEIWNPDTGEWTVVDVPYAHARLYHSTALLLPDGRIMIGGGGTPGPRNYTDVEYYSPAYLFDGQAPAVRPVITNAPKKVGYNGTFNVTSSTPASRVTLVRNGSVTHGFNNDQNFQDLEFTQDGSGTISITSPEDGTYAPPGAYMLFVFDEDGTPSVADIVDIDPQVKMDQRTPKVVDQFEYPRVPVQWSSANPPTTIDVAPGNGRMSPWEVSSQVQLIRGTAPSQGGLGLTGYHLALGSTGSLERTLRGLDPGREYRISMRYARDSRSAGTAPATASVSVGDLDATLTATTDMPSQASGRAITFGTYVGTFTASARSQTLALAATGGAGMMIDDLVVVGQDAGVSDVPIHYEFEEGSGTSAANTGTDTSVGPATLTGSTTWTDAGVLGGAVDLPGGANSNAVDLPDNLLQGEDDFTTSFWVRPDAKANWIGMFHIGDGLGDAGSFFQIQMQTDARAGGSGLAATFKAKGSNAQERVYATPTRDVVANQWNHVVFTRQGATGTLYLNGEQIASRADLTIDMTDVGPTTNNWLGRNGYPDPALNGQMDDVRLYTSTLSATDVTALYDDGVALDTTTTASVDPVSPSPFATPLTVSATVDGEDDQPASGTAELFIDGARVGAVVDVVDGEVSFPEVTLAPGAHDIEVRFTADDGWRDSTDTVTHTVERPPPGEGVPIHYTFDEGSGTSAANTGTDTSVGPATLTNNAGWTTEGQFGAAVTLPGGGAGPASGSSHVNLPNNITAGMDAEFSVSTWIRPTTLPNWTTHLQIGKSTEEFFLLQSSTENGDRGFAATLRVNNGEQYRIQLPGETDLPFNQWTHVVVTLSPSPTGGGTTGRIYVNGQLATGGVRNNIPVDIGDVGDGGTTANFVGNTSWNDPRPTERVDDLRMYGYELTAEQVTELFEDEGPVENAAPVAANDAYGTDEGEALTVTAPGVLDNDTDADGDELTATGLTQPANGVVTLGTDGGFTYTPDAAFSGTDTFTYTAADATGASAPATVTITVQEGEDPPVENTTPVAANDAWSTVAGSSLSLPAPGVLVNDTDADPGDVLTATGATQPAHGSVTLGADGSFTYTPAAGYSGADSFTYRADDGTATSAPATVSITVRPATGGGGGGDEKATSAVAGVALPVTYGQSTTVSVAVAPAAATGSVELVRGGTSLATAVVADGRATLVLGEGALPPGVHGLSLRYLGDATHKASSSTVWVVVEKVVATMTVKAPSTIDRGERAKVRVTLRAPGSVAVEGTVTLSIKNGRTLTGELRNGRVKLLLPKAVRPGKLKATVSYAGSDLVDQARTKVVIRVRR